MQPLIFSLPAEMNNVISATIIDSVNGDILFCHDNTYLYAAKITKVGGSVIFQRFSLPNLVKLIPIIKNYFIALFNTAKLVVFEVWFNEENKVMLKYLFTKAQKPCVSYFLRQVVDNMAELHMLYPQNDIFVYQFTINGKIGHMDYNIGPQNKIKVDRHQLYGSKTIMCPQKKIFYYFASFSNKFVNSINLAKLQNQVSQQWKTTPLTYICLPKIQEHYLLLANMIVLNITNPGVKHKVQIDQMYSVDMAALMARKSEESFRITTYFDMVLIQDYQLRIAVVLQIKQKGSALVAVEFGEFLWFWTATRKLVGFCPSKNSFKMIDNLTKNKKIAQPIQKAQEKQVQLQIKPQSPNFLPPLKKESVTVSQIPELTQEKIQQMINKSKLLKMFDAQSQIIKKEAEELAIKEKQAILSNGNQPGAKQYPPPPPPPPPPPNQKSQLQQKFVPTKVIQKKGVNISKTINKPKQVEPMPQNKEKQVIIPAVEEKEEEIRQQDPKMVSNWTPPEQEWTEAAKQQNTEVQVSDIISRQQKSILDIVESSSPLRQQQSKEGKIQEDKDKAESLAIQSKIQRVQGQVQGTLIDKKQVDNVQGGKQERSEPFDNNLSKNLTLLMQKRSLGADSSTYTSIDRNKIFNNAETDKEGESTTKPTQQQMPAQFYNPLLSHSPLSSKQQAAEEKQEPIISKQQLLKQALLLIKQNFPYKAEIQQYRQQLQIKERNKNNVEGKEGKKISQSKGENKISQQKGENRVEAKDQGKVEVKEEEKVKIQEKKQSVEDEPYNIQIIAQDGQRNQGFDNKQLLQKIKILFHETTSRLLKTLEQVAESSSLEPYLKQKVKTEIQNKVMQTLKRQLSGQFATKVELFFRQLFRQTSAVQQESVKFYKEAAQHKSSLIQVLLFNQQKVLKDIKDVENMIRVTQCTLRTDSQQLAKALIKDWGSQLRQAQKVVENLEKFKNKMEVEAEKKSKRYQETKIQLEAIKSMLEVKIVEQEQRKQKQLQKEAAKLLADKQKKKPRVKKTQKKMQHSRERKTRTKRICDN